MSIELLIVSADHVLFQTKAQHAAGLAAAAQSRSEAAPVNAIGEDFCAACAKPSKPEPGLPS